MSEALPALKCKAMCRKNLGDLPLAVLDKLFTILAAEDVVNLSHTCSFLRALALESVPNLLLTLYPHQVNPPSKALT